MSKERGLILDKDASLSQLSRVAGQIFPPYLLSVIFVLLALIFCVSPSAQAGTRTWVAGGAAGNWADSNNWDTAPSSGDGVVFDNTGQSPLENIFLNANHSIDSLTINLTTGSNQNWNLGADDSTLPFTLTLTSGSISVSSSSGTGLYVIGATTGINLGTGIMTLATSGSGFTFNNSRTNGGLLQINAIVSGSSKTVTKTGAGAVILSGANTYTGATTVSAGVLNIQNATGLGTTAAGTTVISGAALQLQGGITIGAETLTLDGAGISSTGALRNISGNNNLAGTITINSTTRIDSDSGTLTLNVASGNAITGSNNNLQFGGAGNVTIDGVVASGSGTLTKDGTGTLILNAPNTYTGATIVSAGVLNIQNATGLGTIAGSTTVSSGATLQLQGGITIGVEGLTISGTGASGQNGALVSVSGTNNYGGVLNLVAASTISSDSGTLNLTNTGTITGPTLGLTLTGSGAGTVSSIIGTTSGTLTKSGAGTWTLLGANTYTGATTINGGTLTAAASSGSALGSTSAITVNSGGTLLLGANDQINNAASITLGGGTFAKGDFSEGSANTTGVGGLSLSASGSHLDFGTGTVGTVTLASFTPGAYTLTINNWTGTASTLGSGSTDQLIFATDQSANLSSFNFTGFAPGAIEFSLGAGYYEITPAAVPEPSTYVAGALALGAVLYHRRRRFTLAGA